MIIGLTGAAGSGKDSVADILVAEHGFRRIAFADCLYEEVSAAFNVPIEFLKNRDTKEKPSARLSLGHCMDGEFAKVVRLVNHRGNRPIGHSIIPYSPRQILQWWGTDYRRAQRETYWIDKVRDRLLSDLGQDWVMTDVRFQNEANLVRELGGQLGLVIRPGVEPVAGHVSEAFWQTCSPDVIIQNDGALEDLVATVNLTVLTWYDVCFSDFLERDSLPGSLPVTSPSPETGVVVDDDWTLADTILARKILLNLGFAMHPSVDLGADERVDRIAKILADHRSAIQCDHQ